MAKGKLHRRYLRPQQQKSVWHGYCCASSGKCGDGTGFCGTGCQPLYGNCTDSTVPSPPRPGDMGPAVVPTASYAPDRRSVIAALPVVGAATRRGTAILRLASRSSETVQKVASYRLMALAAAPTAISAWAPSMATAAPRVDGAVTPTATVWLAVRRNSVIAPETVTYRLTALAEAPRAIFVLGLGMATAALRPDGVVTRTAIASLAANMTSAHVLVVTSRLMALVGRTTVVKHASAQHSAAVALPEAIVATKSIIVLKGGKFYIY
ncbi:hypothetical protein DL766_005394 [Monosporascus sp. MC13-8B]|uniref:Chitin-binding type-1 domain-containing protein n=1 Tax=Monosporascus cannonballus TaxID=155416 RepID=A0ABY0HEA8_9PEZI|nr:hypothetical protein DL762_002216 [Monosporascus cannonballus]RYP01325.1 hypothetical protein DL763_000297 [Monosporascus cannonballus]RYP29376.1 hypothetical protein DL766_005394 [Monosporascus sp. MC13-8B]